MELRSFSVLAAAAFIAVGIWAQGFFPELPYPGGYTFLRYEVRGPDGPASSWILEVVPKGESYEVRMTMVNEISDTEGFSLLRTFMGAGTLEGGADVIPLAPIFSLWDKEIEAGKSYLLRERARLITEREDEILGIPVVVGTYVHPLFPRQRAVIYLPRLSHRALLLFPPYIRVEEKADGEYRLVQEIELVEFVHED